VLGTEFDITVRSHRLHAQRFGRETDRLVVGLHGLSLNMKAFDYIGEWLGEGFQLVALDLRGRGNSPPTPPGTHGWDNHALDAFAVADALGFERFSIIGQSMGGSVAMKAAEIDPDRLDAVVLIDIAGRVDRGAAEFIGSVMTAVHDEYKSIDAYLDAIKGQGLVEEWNEYWDRCYRYGSEVVDGRVRARVDRDALAEDRTYSATNGGGLYVYERWKHLTMPTLLLRATREFRPGVGHVVPADDRQSFLRDVPTGSIIEIDANHLTINVHPRSVEAIRDFLTHA
jgi:pimeloyl-ACP methyl ester carboxylesterase